MKELTIPFTAYQLTDILGLSQARIRHLCREGILRAKKVKRGNKLKRPGWRVTPEELVDFVLRCPHLAPNRDMSLVRMIRKEFM